MNKRELNRARRAHDARYAVDHPKPTSSTIGQQPTVLDYAMAYVWLLWLALALAGAVISAPHTIATLRATLPEHAEAVKVAVSLAGFAGVECGLLGLSLVQALHRDERRPWALWLLLACLFVAALVFNEADALQNSGDGLLVAAIAGALGPVLLALAGHRLAVEVTQAARRSDDLRLSRAIVQWRAGLDRSWSTHADEWLGRMADDGPKVRATVDDGRTMDAGGGLTDDIARTLRTFADEPGATFGRRAEILDTSTSTVKRWTQAAVDGGLVAKHGRGEYELTNDGRLAINGSKETTQ
jgi:hypothetical protein